jgi:hypothetical protein
MLSHRSGMHDNSFKSACEHGATCAHTRNTERTICAFAKKNPNVAIVVSVLFDFFFLSLN